MNKYQEDADAGETIQNRLDHRDKRYIITIVR